MATESDHALPEIMKDENREARNDAPAVHLPFHQQPLEKRDFEKYEALFAEYLDVQKRINIRELSRDEVKGRWKSFLGKWNKRGLAEGWYDPEAKTRADERSQAKPHLPQRQSRDRVPPSKQEPDQNHSEDEDEDDFGPSLLGHEVSRAGPAIPNLQDLQHRQELADEAARNDRADSRYDHQMDRKEQKSRLEELVPRADPGSRERQIEKKADKTSVLHSFREAKDGGEVEVKDSDLMGDDEGFKAELKKREKVKNEREIRKEEFLRARIAEREARMRGYREKEEKTMSVLREIARERFG
ncbi:hypothetical protein AC578_1893 [Pseudocercospora eumusae]|uniref:RNA helicase HEL117 n=1 Tax=Pseudocercospora eumusae TaxID=321146 RepID=A0A139H3M1_9PEZI|nr:hypothetical protein AC578_1893 [Pseudocercospora eumusae]